VRPRIAVLALLLLIAAGGAQRDAAPTSAEIEIRSESAQNQFPDGIRFSLFMSSDAEITQVRLRFRIFPDGVNASIAPSCTGGTSCNVVVGSSQESYMVPGAQVIYYWELTDSSGASLTTDQQTVIYEDTRFEWEQLTQGNLTVNYYFGDAASNQTVLDVAEETFARFTKIERTTIDFPVKIWVYRTAAEMAPAVASRIGNGPNSSVRTLGEVAASDTALVSRDSDFLNIVRHELTHIVTGAATRNYLADIPVWINEGLSTYAQHDLLPSESQALDLAIQRDAVLPITSLGSAARGNGNQVSIFYAESGSIIAYMMDVLGEDKFGDFLQALATDTTDGALQTVYGFDTLGLENAWRTAVGLPEVEPGATTGSNAAPIPTLVPFGASPGSSPAQATPVTEAPDTTQVTQEQGGSSSTLPIVIGVLVLFVLAAGTVYIRVSRGSAKS
jgi:Peptidase MA superfamily